MEDLTLLNTLSQEFIIEAEQKNMFQNIISSVQKTLLLENPENTPKKDKNAIINFRKKSMDGRVPDIISKTKKKRGSQLHNLSSSRDGSISHARRNSDPDDLRTMTQIQQMSKATGTDTSVNIYFLKDIFTKYLFYFLIIGVLINFLKIKFFYLLYATIIFYTFCINFFCFIIDYL